MQSSIPLGNWNVEFHPWETLQLIVTPRQVHGSTIVSIENARQEADGIIATRGNTSVFGIYTADCLPLVITTPTKALALHISRHTLIAGILESAKVHLQHNMVNGIYMGPHICERCFVFETKGEGIIAFQQKYPYAVKETSQGIFLSLERVVLHFLQELGVSQDIIQRDDRCTYEDPTLLSYKRLVVEGAQGSTLGRMVTSLHPIH